LIKTSSAIFLIIAESSACAAQKTGNKNMAAAGIMFLNILLI
jgi:hypothetical protein